MTASQDRWPHGRETVVVVLLLIAGAALRLCRLDLGWFGVDQARDIATGLAIAHGDDLPTVGPTMHLVTSLGAFYYYFWSLPFVVARDPLAAYRFAALLGVAAVAATWYLARRLWGPGPAVVALAIAATFPIAVINTRIAWAPAALPATAVAILWLLLGLSSDPDRAATAPPSTARIAALGAVLGLAIQLHLAMIAWVAASVVVLLLDRVPVRRLVIGAITFVATALPALWVAMSNAGGDAGLGSLATRAPIPNVVARLAALFALTWRIPEALAQDDHGVVRAVLARPAAVVVSTVVAAGLARLALRSIHDRAARIIVIGVVLQVAMVVGLPGNAGYHYLDPILPLWALCAGALVAPPRRAEATRPANPWSRWHTVVAGITVAASLVLALDIAIWLAQVARAGYMSVDLRPLSLDATTDRETVAGRLLSTGVLRATTAILSASQTPVAALWLTLHGPAFDDVTGDNGFWLRWQAARSGASSADLTDLSSTAAAEDTAQRADGTAQSQSAGVEHAAIWFRHDAAAPLPRPGSDDVVVGPLVIVRYAPTIDYASCRSDGTSVTVPIRLLAHPRRYGDGTRRRPPTLPRRIACTVAPGTGSTLVVAAVTTGTVTVSEPGGRRGRTDRESTLCIRRGAVPSPFMVEIELPAGASSDLDVYERADGSACAG